PEHRPVGQQVVPLLARHLTRLAADAHRGVGEEPHALGALAMDGDLGPRGVGDGVAHGVCVVFSFGCSAGCSRLTSTWPWGALVMLDVAGERRRPRRTLQVSALVVSIV